jgi:uncharacterized protein YjbI with pentapeptide repeats
MKHSAQATDYCHFMMTSNKPCGEEVIKELVIDNIPRCVFHHQARLPKHEEIFQTKFRKKITEELEDNSIESLDFTGYVFSSYLWLSLEFSKSVCFRWAVFRGQPDFHDCKFMGTSTDFRGVHFDGPETIFKGAIFSGDKLDFSQSKFRGVANFSHAEFNNVTFSGARFAREAMFQNAIFTGTQTSFDGVEFQGNVFFNGADFNSQNNSFADVTFLADSFFNSSKESEGIRKTRFAGHLTSFGGLTSGTIFRGQTTTFVDAVFRSEITTFIRTKFHSSKETNFDEAIFDSNIIDFSYSDLQSENVTFRNTKFKSEKEDIHFHNCWFKGLRTLFHDTTFKSKKADFRGCVFDNAVDFKRNYEKNTETMFEGGASMRDVIFLSPEKATFRHVDLSSVEFRGTDLRRIQFISVNWAQYPRFRLMIFLKTKMSGIQDEDWLTERRKRTPDEIELVQSAYRQLKQNYDESKNYSVADHFYFGEMEITRICKKYRWQRILSWRGLYRYAGGYGLQWENSLFFMTLIFFGFPILFITDQLQYIFNNVSYCASYWHAIQYNFLAVTFQKDINLFYKTNVLTRNLAIIESFVMPILATLFVLALRRRFKR